MRKFPTQLVTSPPTVNYSCCDRSAALTPLQSQEYLLGGANTCPNCKATIDWWKTLLAVVKEDNGFGSVMGAVGAQSTYFQIELQRDQLANINLVERGVPQSAQILQVNYSPQFHPGVSGGLQPLEVHGNSCPRYHSHDLCLYPRPFKEPFGPTRVNVRVLWILPAKDDASWQSLTDAFEYFWLKKYGRCVIPANVAVESALSRLVSVHLEKFASAAGAKKFREGRVTYTRQLDDFLPMIAKTSGNPLLPPDIFSKLKQLRKLRNQVAHKGMQSVNLSQDEAAELMCAAMLGFYYIGILEDNGSAAVETWKRLDPALNSSRVSTS